MANINITQIRMKRGNTAAASTYTGPLGELLVDTGLKTIRVQDGVTPGGMATLATNVQLQALGTYANATFGTSSYGNANVGLYLSTSSIIGNINANVTAANAAITSLTSNAATQATLIDAINANVTAANAAITSLTSNAAIQASLLDTLTGNAASQSTLLDTLTSNAATQATSLTTLLSNAVTQQTSLTDLVANAAIQAQAIANAAGTYGNANVAVYLSSQNITSANIGGSQTYANTQVNTISANLGAYQTYANANATTQATSINTVNANLGAYQTYGNLTFSTVTNAASQSADITTLYTNAAVQSANIATLFSNAATQSDSIVTLQTQVYANANVAAYLPTYTGNIAGNIVKSGYTWTFSNTGTTTFPTGVRLSNARGANTVNFTTDIDKSFQIETQTSTTGRLWSFGTDGNLTLPQNANINFSNGVSILAGITGTYSNANVAAYLPTYSGAISANIAKNGYTWRFGTNGTTQFPGAQILAPAGESITMQSDQYSQLMWENANVTVAPNMAINSNFYVAQNNATLDIGYRDGSSTQLIKTWLWSVDGGMYFPDTTTQYTAFSNAAVATYLSNYDGGINFTASPAVITGLGNISSANFTFANGVNILSTVGAGAYGNTQVATYLLHFDGDIEFTSSTAKIGNVDVITVGDHIRSPAYQFSNGASILSGVVSKTTGSWTVTAGTNTYSFTVPASGTYQLWVDCNIPNGIIAWNATATVTNTNVPVVGAQYAWVYTGGGTPIDFTSIPNQFTGTANTIVRSSVAPSSTTNRFDFGLNNTSGGNVTVRYGWIAIS